MRRLETEQSNVLQVKDLHVKVKTKNSEVSLVQDLNFELKRGSVLGLVGESGCGKTVTSMSILQLLDRKTSTIEGSITLQGRELNGLGDKDMRKIRGKDIAFIMQKHLFLPLVINLLKRFALIQILIKNKQ